MRTTGLLYQGKDLKPEENTGEVIVELMVIVVVVEASSICRVRRYEEYLREL